MSESDTKDLLDTIEQTRLAVQKKTAMQNTNQSVDSVQQTMKAILDSGKIPTMDSRTAMMVNNRNVTDEHFSGQISPGQVATLTDRAKGYYQLGLLDQAEEVELTNLGFPTLLSRINIFPPHTKSQQKTFLDEDNQLTIDTVHGSITRSGPNLTVQDEDVLWALIALSKLKVSARSDSMISLFPTLEQDHTVMSLKGLKQINQYKDADDKVYTYVFECTYSQIIKLLGLTRNSINYDRVHESIKRLALTSLMIELKDNKHYEPFTDPMDSKTRSSVKSGAKGIFANFDLLSIVGDYEINDAGRRVGRVEGVFSTVISRWIHDQRYIFMDFQTRRGLNDIGKCVHKYLCGQPKLHRVELYKLQGIIGYRGKRFKRPLEQACSRMQELGFLGSYEINGSKLVCPDDPFVLVTERIIKTRKPSAGNATTQDE